MGPMWRSARIMPKSSLKAASQIAIVVLLFGLAKCAAENNGLRQRGSFSKKINTKSSRGSSSCLSYGHSCWGAHGKRSGVAAPDGGIDGNAIAAALQQASPEDTRWFLSKLIGSKMAVAKPRGNFKEWQLLAESLKGAAEAQSNEMRDSGTLRSDSSHSESDDVDDGDMREGLGLGVGIGVARAGAGDGGRDSGPDDELLVMASPAEEAEINRGAQKLRLYKIMNRASSKNMI